MPPQFVKMSALGFASSGPASGAFAGGNTSGNCLVVMVQTDNGSVFTIPPYSAVFSDSAGNSYSAINVAGEGTFRSGLCVFVCPSCKPGANSLLLSGPPGGATGYRVQGLEISGADPVNPVDVAATQAYNQLNTPSLALNITLSKARELIIWCYEQGTGSQTTSSITPGYTELPGPSSHNFFVHSSGLLLPAGATTVNVSKSNAWWAEVAIALFEGGSAQRTLVGVGR